MTIAGVASIGGFGLTLGAAAGADSEEKPKPMFMFVQVGEDLKVDTKAKTFSLVGVSPHTIYFADRPERIVGHIRMEDYFKEWTSKAGADNFGKDPPNAALSIYEPGQPNNTLTIVEIRNPKIEGSNLIYSFNLLEGELPANGGPSALFIDWIGPGGGVGVGFHGVGVGRRGPGWR